MTGDELEALTFQHLPKSFLQRSLKATFLAHRVAREECRAQFGVAEAENLMGYYRRAKLEGYLRDAATNFPGVEAAVSRVDQSHWNYVEVRGGPVVLTEHSVLMPGAVVRRAEFRANLARTNQMGLWSQEVVPDDARLYVLLVHSPSRWLTPEEADKFGHLPGSAHLAYPSPDLESYLHIVNLFEMFPAVVDAEMPAEWDTEARVRYLDRSRRIASA